MHNPHRQRGVATIEFAICVPVLLLLMLATAELGRAMFQYNTLVKAVRDGARHLATNASVGSQRIVSITAAKRTETLNLVVTGNIAGTGTPLLPGLTIANVSATDAGNGFVSVSANYTYRPALGATLPTFGFGAPINLSMTLPATVIMRAL
jgi:Flp pilus assembly protein TadG